MISAEKLGKKSIKCKAMLFQSSANGAGVGSFLMSLKVVFVYRR